MRANASTLWLALLLSISVVSAHGSHKPSTTAVSPQCSCPSSPPPTHLASCEFVSILSAEKAASRVFNSRGQTQHGSRQRALLATLFPFDSPGANALLSTFYISSVPNFILWFVPADIDPSTLNTMVAFATGGLLGDVFLHLLPETFLSSTTATTSPTHSTAVFVMVDERRNVVLGGAIFIGFAIFFLMEKVMRVMNGGGDGSHSHSHGGHSHSHSHGTESSAVEGKSSSIEDVAQSGLRKRTAAVEEETPVSAAVVAEPSPQLKLAAFLNLFADAAHNCTDGIAIAASFYASPAIGATTTIAVFFHEIPHEMADFSILLKSGFTKKQAMISQFITALGAFVGTFIGIALHASTSAVAATPPDESSILIAAINQSAGGLFGTSVDVASCIIPITAGGFLYIATVGVVPSLLSDTKGVREGGVRQLIKESLAMAIGAGSMAALAWNE